MVATRLLFAAHTTQEPNQNVCSTHDKKWRIAHDCSMWRGQTLHFFRVSSQLCLVTYSAYNLIKFRHKNYLVRVRKRSWFGLKYQFLPVAAYMAEGILKVLLKTFGFVTKNVASVQFSYFFPCVPLCLCLFSLPFSCSPVLLPGLFFPPHLICVSLAVQLHVIRSSVWFVLKSSLHFSLCWVVCSSVFAPPAAILNESSSIDPPAWHLLHLMSTFYVLSVTL